GRAPPLAPPAPEARPEPKPAQPVKNQPPAAVAQRAEAKAEGVSSAKLVASPVREARPKAKRPQSMEKPAQPVADAGRRAETKPEPVPLPAPPAVTPVWRRTAALALPALALVA